MQKLIYIIRHGQTENNRRRIIQGQGVDSSLNEAGQKEAQLFYEKYREEPFDLVITSSLKRTHETVAAFIDMGLSWVQFQELNEIAWGRHEGQESTPEMIAEYKRVAAAWQSGQYDERIADGESANELAERLERFVAHLRERSEQRILVCSHGRAMRCLMCLLNGDPISAMDTYHHDNTGLYLLQQHGTSFSFLKKNDLSHLD
ncbi:MAG TPA: histidine phosphatase family protein [Saprospiraceae bacterium]|nr:histidine phosphatase family protein [Saprospiraceae bacterium]HMQ85860.1 histidine phosphatase family protein [Saprospiraceae bacterium]